MDRRRFLKTCLFLPAGVVLGGLSAAGGGEGLIRPPGALSEDDFRRSCLRCGMCVKVCPARCLKPAPVSAGPAAWGTPRMVPREAGCIRCGSCAAVCPSGAIRRVAAADMKTGTARIERGRCLVWTHARECLVCREFCPVGAVEVDDAWRPVVNAAACVGCGVCEENCPVVGGAAAIRVSASGERRYHRRERKYF